MKLTKKKEATHKISACYFPGKGEVELTIEDMEIGENVAVTFPVDEKTGNKLAEVVNPCVYHGAVVDKLSPEWQKSMDKFDAHVKSKTKELEDKARQPIDRIVL